MMSLYNSVHLFGYLNYRKMMFDKKLGIGLVIVTAELFFILYIWRQSELTDCLHLYFKGSFKRYDNDFIDLIKEKYLFRPSKVKNPLIMEPFNPPWKRLSEWDEIQENLLEFFTALNRTGKFVEIGAVDGFFMSHSLYLENFLNWTGILIEPDPRNFKKLLQNGRNATYCSLCIFQCPPSVRLFWQRNIDENLPDHFKNLLSSRSGLRLEVHEEDIDVGTTIFVPCAQLSSILIAAEMRSPDLVILGTDKESFDETKLSDIVNERKVEAKTLLLTIPASYHSMHRLVEIPGFIEDQKRSMSLTKFLIKNSYCQLVDNETCVDINHLWFKKACHTYKCFNNITVHAINVNDLKSQMHHILV